ncbi:MAG: hypothetical protein ABH815_02475 [Candidatus Omnitrophota bacterium]
MKAFFVGLIFIIAVLLLSGIGFLLLPLMLVLGVLIRVFITIIFAILCIWLLGKFIIFALRLLFKERGI